MLMYELSYYLTTLFYTVTIIKAHSLLIIIKKHVINSNIKLLIK